jgi:membrane-associated phospholipid phosphatase
MKTHVSLLALLMLVLSPGLARAGEPPPAELPASPPAAPAEPAPSAPKLRWSEDWPRFRPVEYVVTGVVGAGAIAEYIWLKGQGQPRWVGGVLFDDAVRNALRLRSPAALAVAWTAADVVGVSAAVLAVGVDSFLVPLLRGSPDVALQLTLMGLESYALSSILSITLYDTVGRARPSYADCKANGLFSADCNVAPNDSFPSGHTNEAFTAAGLSCANHAHVSIYGSRLADTLACVRDVTLATGDGVLRILGDRHYTTDVLAGAAIGFGFGFGVPALLHYRSSGVERPLDGLSVSPMLGRGNVGILAVGRF